MKKVYKRDVIRHAFSSKYYYGTLREYGTDFRARQDKRTGTVYIHANGSWFRTGRNFYDSFEAHSGSSLLFRDLTVIVTLGLLVAIALVEFWFDVGV